MSLTPAWTSPSTTVCEPLESWIPLPVRNSNPTVHAMTCLPPLSLAILISRLRGNAVYSVSSPGKNMEKQYRMHCDVTLPDKPHSNNNNKSQDACGGGMKEGGISTQLCFFLLRTKSSKRCQREALGWENTLSGVIKAITICLERTFQSASFTTRSPLRRATKAGKVQVVGGSQGRKETRGLTMWDEAIMRRASCNQGDSK